MPIQSNKRKSHLSKSKGLYIVEPSNSLEILTEENIDKYVEALYKKETNKSVNKKSDIIYKK